jgi:hypothetical protein
VTPPESFGVDVELVAGHLDAWSHRDGLAVEPNPTPQVNGFECSPGVRVWADPAGNASAAEGEQQWTSVHWRVILEESGGDLGFLVDYAGDVFSGLKLALGPVDVLQLCDDPGQRVREYRAFAHGCVEPVPLVAYKVLELGDRRGYVALS